MDTLSNGDHLKLKKFLVWGIDSTDKRLQDWLCYKQWLCNILLTGHESIKQLGI